MSIYLRVVLLIAAIFTFIFIARKLKKAQLQLSDAFFWIMFSTVLVILGIFPQIGIFFAELLGVISASNFIFLVVIFLLIVRSFLQTIKLANLENKIVNLTQEIAVRDNLSKQEEKQKNE